VSDADGSRAFCPRCGAAVEPRAEAEPRPGEPRDRDDALCDDCYFAGFELVDAPDELVVDVCDGCGAVRRGDSWRDVGARDYTDVAVDAVTETLGVHVRAEDVRWGVEPEQVDATTIRMRCQFSGVVRGRRREETVVVPVSFSTGTCDRCGRIAGGARGAVVQVRAAGRAVTAGERARAIDLAESFVADREAAGDRGAFVSGVEETDDGPDIKLSTPGLGEAVAGRITDELGGSVESHPTLVTEDGDGNEVYRVTFAVRLPRFRPGDVIDPRDGDGPVLVTGGSGRLTGRRLASGDRYEADDADPSGARRLGHRSDGAETVLVTVEDEHAVQVLDPETYEAKTVPRPDFLDPDAEAVTAFKSRAGLHLLPPEPESGDGPAGDRHGA